MQEGYGLLDFPQHGPPINTRTCALIPLASHRTHSTGRGILLIVPDEAATGEPMAPPVRFVE